MKPAPAPLASRDLARTLPRRRFLMATLACLGKFLPSAAAGADRDDLVAVAVRCGTLTRLLAAMRAADAVTLLRGAGPLTLFAPDDDAFAALPAGNRLEDLLRPENGARLRALLLGHLVAGRWLVGDLRPGELPTLGDSALTVRRGPAAGELTVNGARLLRADLAAANGVLHVVARVLPPASGQPPR